MKQFTDYIYKYPLKVTDEQQINIPLSSEILCVDVQRGTPCLWVKVNSDTPVPRTIYIHGTGHPMNKRATRYIGTFMLLEGALVFHVFEEE